MRKSCGRRRRALEHTLGSLGPDDRFALISFATTPISFREELSPADENTVRGARDVGRESGGGGRNRHRALRSRPHSRFGPTKRMERTLSGRVPDGRAADRWPEGDVRDPRGSSNRRESRGIRIYTFGVGDDVDAHLLDLLAEKTSGCSTYVRPNENLDAKVSAFSNKIGRPVRTDLKLTISGGPRLVEMYPPRLPDLFQGDQLQIAGRFEGDGPADLTLTGHSGDESFSESFATEFPEMASDHNFVAPIWARRKVGYLLDQVR